MANTKQKNNEKDSAEKFLDFIGNATWQNIKAIGKGIANVASKAAATVVQLSGKAFRSIVNITVQQSQKAISNVFNQVKEAVVDLARNITATNKNQPTKSHTGPTDEAQQHMAANNTSAPVPKPAPGSAKKFPQEEEEASRKQMHQSQQVDNQAKPEKRAEPIIENTSKAPVPKPAPSSTKKAQKNEQEEIKEKLQELISRYSERRQELQEELKVKINQGKALVKSIRDNDGKPKTNPSVRATLIDIEQAKKQIGFYDNKIDKLQHALSALEKAEQAKDKSKALTRAASYSEKPESSVSSSNITPFNTNPFDTNRGPGR